MSDETKQKGSEISESKKEDAAPESAEKASGKSRKKKIWKWIGIVAGVLVVLLAALVICRDPLIELAVRRGGTWLMGTPVEIGSFDSSLGGSVEIKELTVGNPEGYHAEHIFKVKRVWVALDLASLVTDKIIVEEVAVEGLEVDFESKVTETNLGVLQDNVNRRLSPLSGDKEGKEPDSSKEEAPAQQLVIRKLDVTDSWVSISTSLLKTSVPLPLPPVHMTDVGDGQSIGDTVNGFFGLIGTGIKDAAVKSGGAIGDALKGVGGSIGDALHNSGTAIKEGVKGIFGK